MLFFKKRSSTLYVIKINTFQFDYQQTDNPIVKKLRDGFSRIASKKENTYVSIHLCQRHVAKRLMTLTRVFLRKIQAVSWLCDVLKALIQPAYLPEEPFWLNFRIFLNILWVLDFFFGEKRCLFTSSTQHWDWMRKKKMKIRVH